MNRQFGILLLLLAAGCALPTFGIPYICREVSPGAIVIDGCLGEAAWENADVVTNFHVYSPKGQAVPVATAGRVLWDSENLYVAIQCSDGDIWSCSDRPGEFLWRGDVGEIFIKPSRARPVYYEFIAAPDGTLVDVRHASRGAGGYSRFKEWSSGTRVATAVDGTDDDPSDTDIGYTIEMAIPLSAFQGSELPADGVVWTFCFFRYEFSKLFDQPFLLMSMPESLHNGFHYYEGYADLIFRSTRNHKGE